MWYPKVTELSIKKASNKKGMVAITSFVLNNNLYIGSVAIYKVLGTKEKYRLVYPTKNNYPICYPITKDFAKQIEVQVISLYRDSQND